MAYTPAQIEISFTKILTELASGKPLRTVLQEDGMPAPETFFMWLGTDELKTKRYRIACEARADLIFEDMLDIADNESQDMLSTERGEAGNMVKVQRDKLRIDTRKWQLARLAPKKYGDSVKLTGDADNPIQSKLTIEILPAVGRIASSEGEIDAD